VAEIPGTPQNQKIVSRHVKGIIANRLMAGNRKSAKTNPSKPYVSFRERPMPEASFPRIRTLGSSVDTNA
jgi:hypothetical protein